MFVQAPEAQVSYEMPDVRMLQVTQITQKIEVHVWVLQTRISNNDPKQQHP
jgi:hypothetical protein